MHGQSRPDINRITDRTLVYNSHLDIWYDKREENQRNWNFLARKPKNKKRLQLSTEIEADYVSFQETTRKLQKERQCPQDEKDEEIGEII